MELEKMDEFFVSALEIAQGINIQEAGCVLVALLIFLTLLKRL